MDRLSHCLFSNLTAYNLNISYYFQQNVNALLSTHPKYTIKSYVWLGLQIILFKPLRAPPHRKEGALPPAASAACQLAPSLSGSLIPSAAPQPAAPLAFPEALVPPLQLTYATPGIAHHVPLGLAAPQEPSTKGEDIFRPARSPAAAPSPTAAETPAGMAAQGSSLSDLFGFSAPGAASVILSEPRPHAAQALASGQPLVAAPAMSIPGSDGVGMRAALTSSTVGFPDVGRPTLGQGYGPALLGLCQQDVTLPGLEGLAPGPGALGDGLEARELPVSVPFSSALGGGPAAASHPGVGYQNAASPAWGFLQAGPVGNPFQALRNSSPRSVAEHAEADSDALARPDVLLLSTPVAAGAATGPRQNFGPSSIAAKPAASGQLGYRAGLELTPQSAPQYGSGATAGLCYQPAAGGEQYFAGSTAGYQLMPPPPTLIPSANLGRGPDLLANAASPPPQNGSEPMSLRLGSSAGLQGGLTGAAAAPGIAAASSAMAEWGSYDRDFLMEVRTQRTTSDASGKTLLAGPQMTTPSEHFSSSFICNLVGLLVCFERMLLVKKLRRPIALMLVVVGWLLQVIVCRPVLCRS